MRPKLVSIIIINFNYGNYLRESVTSVLAQTYAPLEVVVVDDGSTDGSLEVLREFGAKIKLISKERGGHVSALNAGVAGSTGDVLFFVDADDQLYADCAKKVMSVWRPGLCKVQFRLDTIDAFATDQHMPFPHYPHDLDGNEIKRRAVRFGYYPWPVSTGNAFAREFIAQVTPIPQERIFKSPDGFLNKMAPLYGEIVVLDDVLGAYRVHGRNLWAQSGEGINLETYSRTVRFDAVLHAEFVNVAAKYGFKVNSYASQPVPQWVENRLLSLRLCPELHPIPDDTVLKVLKLGVRGALVSPDINLLGRISWFLWFIALASLPKRALLHVLRRSRAQSHRSRLASTLIKWSTRR